MNIIDTVETPVYLSLISFSSLSPLKQSLNNLVHTPYYFLYLYYVVINHMQYCLA